MRIGLDFDNTIVCYDEAIELLADELFNLPKTLPRTKGALREFLVAAGRELEWTAFQGELYGPGMRLAKPYDGCKQALRRLVESRHEVYIVSHRSRRPYGGQDFDMHAYALEWIKEVLCSQDGVLIADGHLNHAYFMETKEQKVEKARDLKLDYFLDDLVDMVSQLDDVVTSTAILFDPAGRSQNHIGIKVKSWDEFIDRLELR